MLGALTGLASAAASQTPWYLVTNPVQPRCMGAAPAQPVAFPADAREGDGGVVRARMTFQGPNAAPSVEIFANTAGPAFGEAVAAQVAGYRWTCPPEDGAGAVVLTQEFQFVPGAERLVIVGGTWRTRRARDATLAGCEWTAPEVPDYPTRSRILESPDNGAVLLKLLFRGPDEPVVTVLTETAPRRFVAVAREHGAKYRIRCPDASVFPFEARVPYRFEMPGTVRYSFRPTTLKSFLGTVDTIETERVRHDFHTMGCPFDVDLGYWQPYDANRATSAGDRADDRREFLEWLGRLRLRTSSDRTQNDLAGTTLKIHVPCLVLNLL